MSGLSEYDDDHALSIRFALNVPLGFFVGILRAKLELIAKRIDELGLFCALNELF